MSKGGNVDLHKHEYICVLFNSYKFVVINALGRVSCIVASGSKSIAIDLKKYIFSLGHFWWVYSGIQ